MTQIVVCPKFDTLKLSTCTLQASDLVYMIAHAHNITHTITHTTLFS